MSNYKHLTYATFVARLDAGKYATAAAANRALGKIQKLTVTDKEKARVLVAAKLPKAAKATKTEKTAPKTKTTKKTAKKAAKKVVKKVAKK